MTNDIELQIGIASTENQAKKKHIVHTMNVGYHQKLLFTII